jgi:hypothetical protein
MSNDFFFTEFPLFLLTSDILLLLKDPPQKIFLFLAALLDLCPMSIPLFGEICFCCANVFLNTLLFVDFSGQGVELLIKK